MPDEKKKDSSPDVEEGRGVDMDGFAVIDATKWDATDEDEHVRNLYKAEKLLGDVLYRQNMYSMASEHYSALNNAAFTTPSIIITSAASFLSFAGATDPVNSKTFSLTVGFLGTCATIITALQSAYKFDTKAEMFRTGAAEYRLLNTKINSIMRKERVYPQEWQKLWHEIELRMTELQKKLTMSPSRELVDHWKRAGKLDEKDQSGAMMPPWLIRYQQNLEDDGIQSEEDLRFIPDDVFELWEQPYYKVDPSEPAKNKYDPNKGTITRYPLVVIQKIREMRDRQIEAKAKKKKGGFGTNLKLELKPTTQAALRKRGITYAADLRLASDEILDQVVSARIAP